MTEHDEAILKAAEAVHARLASIKGSLPFHEDPTVKALFSAVAAKREAQRPKLLTREQAHDVYTEAFANHHATSLCFQAVLTEAHARVLKVIEGLPMAEVGGYLGHGMKTVVLLDDIRSALSTREG